MSSAIGGQAYQGHLMTKKSYFAQNDLENTFQLGSNFLPKLGKYRIEVSIDCFLTKTELIIMSSAIGGQAYQGHLMTKKSYFAQNDLENTFQLGSDYFAKLGKVPD